MTDSLLNKFQDLERQKEIYGNKKSKCRLVEVMQELPEETSDYLRQIIEAPIGDSRRLSSATISNVLRSEGHNVGRTTVAEHRRRYCQCFLTKDN